jgi:subtilisin family serine protease
LGDYWLSCDSFRRLTQFVHSHSSPAQEQIMTLAPRTDSVHNDGPRSKFYGPAIRHLTIYATCLSFLIVAGAALPGQAARPPDAPLKPGHGKVIADQYIVVLKEGSDAAAVARRNNVKTKFTYTAALSGFSANLSKGELAKVRKDSSVAYVEPDGEVTGSKQDAPPDPSANKAPGQPGPASDGVTGDTTQTSATWGIDRVDQRTGINGSYNYTNTGSGVTAYVIDSGINTAHTQFGGRARAGFDVMGDGRNGQDCHGHGTHVAGTIGGSTYGVAKSVSLVAVRVLNCSNGGTMSGLIAGVDWVTYTHNGPSVANMSVGGAFNQAMNDAVTRSIASGVTYVISAGNDNVNACTASPASTPSALTVGATSLSGSTDVRAPFSNWGSCLDVFDPGVNIRSAWIGSTTATNIMNVTSMAAPHVAGQVALYLQVNPYATPAVVDGVIKSTAATGTVSDPKGSPNRFARKWNGNLSATGANSYQPDGSSWFQTNAGYIQGWLSGTTGRDTDLYLERWNGTTWVRVASSVSVTARERIVYQGTGSTYYRFRIHQASGGAGSYDLWTNHPA